MQTQLDLKSYSIPDDAGPRAKALCNELIEDIDKTHDFYKQQFEFLKQQYKIALMSLRPGTISIEMLELMFDESEMTSEEDTEPNIEDEEKKSKPKKKRRKKQKAIPDHLPRTIVEHDIPEDQKVSPLDGSPLHPIGYDVTEELKYTPAKFEVIEHRYLKYASRSNEDGVVREKPAPKLIPGSYASSELLANIAVSKFCNHLPLYRQEKIYGRDGVFLTRQVMADWMIKLGEALNPLLGIMHEKILESPVVHADETPVKVLTKKGIRTSHQAYMWQVSRWGSNPLILFEYDASRKKEVAARLLGTYEGYVQIDGYAGYDLLFGEGSPRTRVGCMAHCLRKFRNFLATLPKEDQKRHPASQILTMMKKLYEIEDLVRPLSPSARLEGRQTSDAEAIFEKLQDFVALEREYVSKDSPYYAALRYADEELPSIRNYLKHGMVELDNNLAENAIRPFAVGRRNWLFICAERGAQASANIYSILTTALANGLEPFAYLTKLINRLPHCETVDDFEKLLPIRS